MTLLILLGKYFMLVKIPLVYYKNMEMFSIILNLIFDVWDH